MLQPSIYRGLYRPADVVVFGKPYPPDLIPLTVKLIHRYGWIPLLVVAFGSFKVGEYLDTKRSRSERQSSEE